MGHRVMGHPDGHAVTAADAAADAKAALEKGLLVLTAKDKLRFLPPLTITYDEIDKGIEILKEILA